jgi:hypothetical protein
MFMNTHTAIKAALWVIAAIASTPAASEHLLQDAAEMPTGDVWPSHVGQTSAPSRATVPTTSNELDPPAGNIPHEVAPQGKKAPPWEIKLDITLTMKRPHATTGTRRSRRSDR